MENKKLFPRCILLKGNSVFVGPDGYLKPCCFVNNARDWNEFLLWVNDNNLDVEDLNLFDQGLDNIKARWYNLNLIQLSYSIILVWYY